jgi:hypothetical protein
MTALRRRMLEDLQRRGLPPRPNSVLSPLFNNWLATMDALPTNSAKRSSASISSSC